MPKTSGYENWCIHHTYRIKIGPHGQLINIKIFLPIICKNNWKNGKFQEPEVKSYSYIYQVHRFIVVGDHELQRLKVFNFGKYK